MPHVSPVVFLSLPGLRRNDLAHMPAATNLCASGAIHSLTVPFPAVTWPAQATMLTGLRPNRHGVIANGFYWRERNQVEMWTAGNEVIEQPQIWDRLGQAKMGFTSAAWFPMLSKRSHANYVCMPAPVHNPDGSESMWCYTQPQDFYRQLLESLGPFPLQHFWGPLANIKSSQWIANSAVIAAERFHPDFFYVYLPHLDYAAQKLGPNSPAAAQALGDLDSLIQSFATRMEAAYGRELVWVIASEYAIVETSHVTYPNRVLREHGLLHVRSQDGEQLDLENSPAWALVDHQFSHIFVRNAEPKVVDQVVKLFRGRAGIRQVLTATDKVQWGMDHPRSGEVILVSDPHSWQAYYWWLDDREAPAFARTVDIHRKPGYDPVELHFDPTTRSIPLNAELVKGSHGAPASWSGGSEVALTSDSAFFPTETIDSTELFPAILRHFRVAPN